MLPRHLRRTLLGLAVLGLPAAMWCGLALQDANAAARPQPVHAVQQLRCWQHGRLILEENDVVAPADSTAIRLQMQAGAERKPLYLVETRNATCLIAIRAPGAAAHAGD